ncbi:MAG: lipid IV(A) 3-deoxy-D-manno-octulosonic acid transferase [Nevskiales bacterium]|nr:lipid IV(A) 3-deoxy-D-manno-octulosonic acid transferase [Nevskiales bacterium]
MRPLYTVLLYLLTPLILLRLLWRSRELREYRLRIGERFGWVRPAPDGIAVWVHAVSVGESLAALPLIRELIETYGPGRVWVTTTTPTGSARITEALGDRIRHSYAPYDLPDVVARFLTRVRPERVVVMETELWPNLFHALARRRIPLMIANARLSPRSFRGYGRVRGFAAATLANCRYIAAQSPADAERFAALGAPADRVGAVGNIKFDQAIPDEQIERGRRLRALIGSARPVWIAASTHDGEETAAVAAHRQLRDTHPEAALILVPRHPQRFDAVARMLDDSGLSWVRRSSLTIDAAADDDAAGAAIVLGDSMGEMFMYFAAGDAAFVGGSLVPVGGHNVLEPAALGLPVLFGPHMHNFLPARELLLGADAGAQTDAGALGTTLTQWFDDPARREAMGAAGTRAVAANRGALQRLLELTTGLSPARP